MVERRLKICYYVSDYGMGHATRCVAVIRGITEYFKDAEFIIKTSKSPEFFFNSLDGYNIRVVSQNNDVGVILEPGTLEVDKTGTYSLFKDWMRSWPEFISTETAFLTDEGVDLVISDIVPQAFTASAKAEIPSVAVSNFTWHIVFSGLFGDDDPDVIRIKDAYACADSALVLPFNEPMDVFENKKEISLITRKVTEDLKFKAGISDEFVIFLNLLNIEDNIPELLFDIPGVKILLPFNSGLNISNSVKIPKSETESQNWIAMCDLVVTKTGYSTISEAVSNGVYTLVLRRDGFAEDEWVINEVSKNGFGEEISIEDLYAGDWILDFKSGSRLRRKSKSRLTVQNKDYNYVNDGTIQVVDEIRKLMRLDHNGIRSLMKI
ncbi:hypothetical protein [Methanoplanus endosymbiosus]|uniref:Glycosyl transferase family 28 C-terminal domain-containing protein n=1 Tax=Methanoplanus endosymbiosus TaxID=33865 RepID=A0A9E7PP28_9EURY|nr:hypothetical protein [Methanoplanus endosymbiosus]UUX92271.1 hypothetical protein L6E24_13130 [Methanoplanus endosymbiosus]